MAWRSSGVDARRDPDTRLDGRRVSLRPLQLADFHQWREVRLANASWLLPWEPSRPASAPDPVRDRDAFAIRCSARARDWQLGTGYGFGIFVAERLVGEINLNSVQRGAYQNAYIGYWVDHRVAGNGYVPEALVVLARFAFERVGLHRVQVSIIPRNARSRRVADKLELRNEGIAERYLEINGVWEDHIRYALTREDWDERRAELAAAWL
ncbi:MAG TPA: GNAT family protein [Acidimicrobiales bacterium]|nr:GNAT family protein [Acidimicrobiales bacterium]